jgi:SAM-dependent methyltransferase
MADEHSQYWSNVAQKYDHVVDLQIGGKTRWLLREKVAKEGRLATLVEFGCGTGFYTGVLSGKADSIVATDISRGMLALAKKQIKAANVKFQIEDCQKTSFPDGAFDTVQPAALAAEFAGRIHPRGHQLKLPVARMRRNGLDHIAQIHVHVDLQKVARMDPRIAGFSARSFSVSHP